MSTDPQHGGFAQGFLAKLPEIVGAVAATALAFVWRRLVLRRSLREHEERRRAAQDAALRASAEASQWLLQKLYGPHDRRITPDVEIARANELLAEADDSLDRLFEIEGRQRWTPDPAIRDWRRGTWPPGLPFPAIPDKDPDA